MCRHLLDLDAPTTVKGHSIWGGRCPFHVGFYGKNIALPAVGLLDGQNMALPLIQLLLDRGVNPEDINVLEICNRGQSCIVKFLIEQGVAGKGTVKMEKPLLASLQLEDETLFCFLVNNGLLSGKRRQKSPRNT